MNERAPEQTPNNETLRQTLLDFLKEQGEKGVTFAEIADALSNAGGGKERVSDILNPLLIEGQIVANAEKEGDRYGRMIYKINGEVENRARSEQEEREKEDIKFTEASDKAAKDGNLDEALEAAGKISDPEWRDKRFASLAREFARQGNKDAAEQAIARLDEQSAKKVNGQVEAILKKKISGALVSEPLPEPVPTPHEPTKPSSEPAPDSEKESPVVPKPELRVAPVVEDNQTLHDEATSAQPKPEAQRQPEPELRGEPEPTPEPTPEPRQTERPEPRPARTETPRQPEARPAETPRRPETEPSMEKGPNWLSRTWEWGKRTGKGIYEFARTEEGRGVLVKATYDTVSSIFGLKAIGDVAGFFAKKGDLYEYAKTRKEKKEMREVIDGLAEYARQKAMEKRAGEGEKKEAAGKEKGEVPEAIARFKEKIKSANIPKEEKKIFLHKLGLIINEHRTDEEAANLGSNEEVKKLVSAHIEGKVNGWRITRDWFNTAMTAMLPAHVMTGGTGVAMTRGLGYAALGRMERAAQANKKFSKEEWEKEIDARRERHRRLKEFMQAQGGEGKSFKEFRKEDPEFFKKLWEEAKGTPAMPITKERRVGYIAHDITLGSMNEWSRAIRGKGKTKERGEKGKKERVIDAVQAAGALARALGLGGHAAYDFLQAVQFEGAGAALLHTLENPITQPVRSIQETAESIGEKGTASGVLEAGVDIGRNLFIENPKRVVMSYPRMFEAGKHWWITHWGEEEIQASPEATMIPEGKTQAPSVEMPEKRGGVAEEIHEPKTGTEVAQEATPRVEGGAEVKVEAETIAEKLQLGEVRKGEGVWQAVRRQLEANPKEWGFSGDATDAKALRGWADRITRDILTRDEYIKGGLETGVRYDPEHLVSYVLEKDADGTTHVAEYVESVRQVDEGGDKLNELDEYEYNRLKAKPEAQAPEEIGGPEERMPHPQILSRKTAPESLVAGVEIPHPAGQEAIAVEDDVTMTWKHIKERHQATEEAIQSIAQRERVRIGGMTVGEFDRESAHEVPEAPDERRRIHEQVAKILQYIEKNEKKVWNSGTPLDRTVDDLIQEYGSKVAPETQTSYSWAPQTPVEFAVDTTIPGLVEQGIKLDNGAIGETTTLWDVLHPDFSRKHFNTNIATERLKLQNLIHDLLPKDLTTEERRKILDGSAREFLIEHLKPEVPSTPVEVPPQHVAPEVPAAIPLDARVQEILSGTDDESKVLRFLLLTSRPGDPYSEWRVTPEALRSTTLDELFIAGGKKEGIPGKMSGVDVKALSAIFNATKDEQRKGTDTLFEILLRNADDKKPSKSLVEDYVNWLHELETSTSEHSEAYETPHATKPKPTIPIQGFPDTEGLIFANNTAKIENFEPGKFEFQQGNAEFRLVAAGEDGKQFVYELNNLTPGVRSGAPGSSFEQGGLADGYGVYDDTGKRVRFINYSKLDTQIAEDLTFLKEQFSDIPDAPADKRSFANYQKFEEMLRGFDRVKVGNDGTSVEIITNGKRWNITVDPRFRIEDANVPGEAMVDVYQDDFRIFENLTLGIRNGRVVDDGPTGGFSSGSDLWNHIQVEHAALVTEGPPTHLGTEKPHLEQTPTPEPSTISGHTHTEGLHISETTGPTEIVGPAGAHVIFTEEPNGRIRVNSIEGFSTAVAKFQLDDIDPKWEKTLLEYLQQQYPNNAIDRFANRQQAVLMDMASIMAMKDVLANPNITSEQKTILEEEIEKVERVLAQYGSQFENMSDKISQSAGAEVPASAEKPPVSTPAEARPEDAATEAARILEEGKAAFHTGVELLMEQELFKEQVENFDIKLKGKEDLIQEIIKGMGQAYNQNRSPGKNIADAIMRDLDARVRSGKISEIPKPLIQEYKFFAEAIGAWAERARDTDDLSKKISPEAAAEIIRYNELIQKLEPVEVAVPDEVAATAAESKQEAGTTEPIIDENLTENSRWSGVILESAKTDLPKLKTAGDADAFARKYADDMIRKFYSPQDHDVQKDYAEMTDDDFRFLMQNTREMKQILQDLQEKYGGAYRVRQFDDMIGKIETASSYEARFWAGRAKKMGT